MRASFQKSIFLLLSLLCVSIQVSADELPGAPVMCAAVFPCDKDSGELLPAYSDTENECYTYWQLQCDYELTIHSENHKLARCEQEKFSDQNKVQKLRKRIRHLKRRAKAARK